MAKFFIRPEGAVEGLYSDEIPLKNLGYLDIKRATNVEFCSDRQEWIVTLPDGTEVYSNANREKALAWERKYCDSLLEAGYRVEN